MVVAHEVQPDASDCSSSHRVNNDLVPFSLLTDSPLPRVAAYPAGLELGKPQKRIMSGSKQLVTKPIILLLLALVCASAGAADAQQSSNLTRIVVVRPERAATPAVQVLIEALREALRDRGYVEGPNIAVEILWLGGNPSAISERLTDSTRPKVDFIVTSGTASTRAAQQATSTIPIIMASVSTDPVVEGFVITFARPGRNITGLTNMSTELAGKRLELLKEAVPKSSRVTVLLDPTRPRTADVREIEEAGHILGVQVKSLVVESVSQFDEAFRTASNGRADALMVISGALFNAQRPRLIELVSKSRLPAMYTDAEYVRAGGLMAYSSILIEQYRRVAFFIDKMVRGAKPADLPVEQPTAFELVINLKTAKQIGLTIPPNVLARADKVIK